MRQAIPYAVLAAAAMLAACNTPKTHTRIAHANDLHKIRHVCIIANPRLKEPADMERHLAMALRRYGIGSEVVAAVNRQRLYEPACRYNLRFKGTGSQDVIRTFNVLLRTPEHVVSQIRFVEGNEAYYMSRPNVQEQTDGIVGRMLGKM